MSADRQILAEYGFVIRVHHRDRHALHARQQHVVVFVLPDHGFDVNRVARPVNRAVGIDISFQIGGRVLPEAITPWSYNRNVLPMPRQYPQIVDRLPAGGIGGERSHAVAVGCVLRLLFSIGPQRHLRLGHWRPGGAVGEV